MFLLLQRLIALDRRVDLLLHLLDLLAPLLDSRTLAIQFCLQVAVLVSPLIMDHLLFIDLASQRLNQPNIAIDSFGVFFFHHSLLFIESGEGLF